MLSIGNILWTFSGDDYFVGEISKLSVIGILENRYYCIDTNGIIGPNLKQILPIEANYNTLVTGILYQKVIHHTISEKEATKFIELHYNKTDNFNED